MALICGHLIQQCVRGLGGEIAMTGDGEVPTPAIPTGGLLIAAWHVLTTHTSYHDLGGDYFV